MSKCACPPITVSLQESQTSSAHSVRDQTINSSLSRTNRYGRVRLDSIPELPLVETGSTGLQSLQTFSVSELKPPEDSGVEETVVYFNTDSGLGIGIEGVTIQGGLEEVTNIDGVTIQAIGTVSVVSDFCLILDSPPRSGCRRGGPGPVFSTNRRGDDSDINCLVIIVINNQLKERSKAVKLPDFLSTGRANYYRQTVLSQPWTTSRRPTRCGG